MKILASNTRTSTYCKCLIFVTSILFSQYTSMTTKEMKEKKKGRRQDTNLTKKVTLHISTNEKELYARPFDQSRR